MSEAGETRFPRAFWALLGVAAAARVAGLVFLPNLMSSEAEAYSKLQLYMQWAATGYGYPDTNFGPVHMLLFWPTAQLFGHGVWPNRIVAAILSVATLFPLFALVRRTADEATALVTTALWSLMSLLIATGVITLAEGPCLFFLVVALWAFARLMDGAEPWNWGAALLFAASLSASMGLRYEIWMYLPMWPLVLWRRRGFARAAAVGAMIGVFPLIHMIVTWRITGNPINFVAVSAATTSLNAAVTPWDERAMLWFQALAKIEGWPLFAAGVVGVVYALVSGRGRLLAGMYAYYLAVVEAQALRAAMAPELHRYATFLVALSLPSIATLLWGLARRVFPSHAAASAAAVIAGLALSSTSLFYFEHVRQEATYFLESFQVADRLRTQLHDDDRVLMGKESHPLIVVESGKTWFNFRVLQYLRGETADGPTTEKVFREWRPHYVLATRHDTSFHSTVPVNFCTRSELYGAWFAPAFEYGPWCLLRREDAPPPSPDVAP